MILRNKMLPYHRTILRVRKGRVRYNVIVFNNVSDQHYRDAKVVMRLRLPNPNLKLEHVLCLSNCKLNCMSIVRTKNSLAKACPLKKALRIWNENSKI